MTTTVSDKTQYWDTFYAGTTRKAPQKPSQFAAFAAGEATEMTGILEVGCGNGRDAEFFGHLGFDVLATDASPEAITLCQQKTNEPAVRYACVPAHKAAETISAFVARSAPICVYGRFFLHAITEEEQSRLLDVLDQSLPAGNMLAFEYRTTLDARDEKAFGDHYRRFLDHPGFCRTLEARGYDVLYQVEGQGFAKYKSEDAHVGRVIARRR